MSFLSRVGSPDTVSVSLPEPEAPPSPALPSDTGASATGLSPPAFPARALSCRTQETFPTRRHANATFEHGGTFAPGLRRAQRVLADIRRRLSKGSKIPPDDPSVSPRES